MKSCPPWLWDHTPEAVHVSDGWETRSLPVEKVRPEEWEALFADGDNGLRAVALKKIWTRIRTNDRARGL